MIQKLYWHIMMRTRLGVYLLKRKNLLVFIGKHTSLELDRSMSLKDRKL